MNPLKHTPQWSVGHSEEDIYFILYPSFKESKYYIFLYLYSKGYTNREHALIEITGYFNSEGGGNVKLLKY